MATTEDTNLQKNASGQPQARRWLSQDLSDLIRQQHEKPIIYDIVIVGSGYGGAMAAAQFAGAMNDNKEPIRICVLERGKEYLPGSFPSQMAELPGHVRFTGTDAKKPSGDGDALFDVRIGSDVCALLANGLGGGSLINAAVMAKPEWGSFEARLAPSVTKDLTKKYETVKRMLGCVDNAMAMHPDVGATRLKKTAALEFLEPGTFRAADLTIEVSATPGQNLNKCTLCGDCMTGCNIGAKKSLDTNLLLTAREQGAEIYTGASVLQLKRIAQDEGSQSADKLFCWGIDVVFSDLHLRDRYKQPFQLRAHKVILAAGALGSPEILLRSQKRSLRFSARLGQQFSCNGDNIAAFYKLNNEVNAVADETTPITGRNDAGWQGRRVGPTITSMLDIKKPSSTQGFLLQEFSVPGPLKRLFEEVVTTSNSLYKLTTADCSLHRPAGPDKNQPDPWAVDNDAILHTALVGVIGHDAASGVLQLPVRERRKTQYTGMIQVVWPDAKNSHALADAMDYVHRLGIRKTGAASPLQADGRVLPNPLWQMAPQELAALFNHPKGPVLTVHPLGGCPIGKDIENGAVDDCGRVFDAMKRKKDAWEGSLMVLDGSIVPASIGANPALTIATLAYRACPGLAKKWGWSLRAAARVNTASGAGLQPGPQPGPRGMFRPPEDCIPAKPLPTKIRISERLIGKVALFPSGTGGPKEYMVELTLRYQDIAVRALMTDLYRKIKIDDDNQKLPSVLRIFDVDVWESMLKFTHENESLRDKKALFIAGVSGDLTVFNRECSTGAGRVLRAGASWFVNRGFRDLSQMVLEYLRNSRESTRTGRSERRSSPSTKKQSQWRNTLNLASHAGEVRRLDYAINIEKIIKESAILAKFKPGKALIRGEKRITYNLRANPFQQLMNLKLTRFPSMSRMAPAILKLDMRFMAIREIPLAQITQQQNQVSALADMASFGMYMARMMLAIHMWTFRKPDTPDERVPERLPTTIPGLPAPEITEIDLGQPRGGIPVRVRLTRYRGELANDQKPPLVMIHGYSASGTTFAHHAIGTSMAQYFADRGRDIWILDLRTSAGMPSAALRWDFEDAALEDIPVAIAHIVRVTGHSQVDVFAHCIGAVMLSMAILVNPKKIKAALSPRIGARENDIQRRYMAELAQLPKSIRRIVLSQKGPVLVYTDDNVVRAYLMRFLRKIALPDDYQFDIKKDQSIREQMMDRLLNLLPYPADEYDRENPFSLFNPAKRTPWVGFRHRMDALYARDFSVNNIPDKTLEYIADLFGPLNLDTVAQAIHFARHDKITNAAGRNTFVNRKKLQKRWAKKDGPGIEYTMSIHGAENGLVDKETLNRMTGLMARAGIRFKTLLEPETGHQDMLIGRGNTRVFEKIENFLNEIIDGHLPPKFREPLWYLPWLGPRFQANNNQPDSIMVMADPAIGNAQAIGIPVNKKGDNHEILPGFLVPITVTAVPVGEWVALQGLGNLPKCDGILVVLCYDKTEPVAATRSKDDGATQPHIGDAGGIAAPRIIDRAMLEPGFLQLCNQSNAADLAMAFISTQELVQQTGIGNVLAKTLRLAVASCQYPAGLLDRPVAEASLQRLADRLVSGEDAPELLLLLGDQIYSDATGGLLDPTRTNDRYLRPHEEWLRMKPLRTVMRKIPVYCMLDDHEIIDNWDPQKKNQYEWHLDQGRAAYEKYQPRPGNPVLAGTRPNAWWTSFVHNGFSFFMADSRTQREPRPLMNAGEPSILGQSQMSALTAWLKSADKNSPKIISSASMLLPRHVGSNSDRLYRDGWDGFPHSLHELLAYIVEENITGVVFLSGDEHVSCVAEITVKSIPPKVEAAEASEAAEVAESAKIDPWVETSVNILSIHSSGLYAPLPFANALPAELPAQDEFSFEFGKKHYLCKTKTEIINKGDGYAMLDFGQKKDAQWPLTLKFYGRDGMWGPKEYSPG